jgi:hypothetical protein
MQHHFLQEGVAQRQIKVHYIAREDMVADVLTKALDEPQHEQFQELDQCPTQGEC